MAVLFVDRRYNYIGYGHGNLWSKLSDFFVVHYSRGLRHHGEKITTEEPLTSPQRWRTTQSAFKTCNGAWCWYSNHERGYAYFRDDGTILGWPGLNYWLVHDRENLVLSEWENADLQMRFKAKQWETSDRTVILHRP